GGSITTASGSVVPEEIEGTAGNDGCDEIDITRGIDAVAQRVSITGRRCRQWERGSEVESRDHGWMSWITEQAIIAGYRGSREAHRGAVCECCTASGEDEEVAAGEDRVGTDSNLAAI